MAMLCTRGYQVHDTSGMVIPGRLCVVFASGHANVAGLKPWLHGVSLLLQSGTPSALGTQTSGWSQLGMFR
jgi:hypothetical protein